MEEWRVEGDRQHPVWGTGNARTIHDAARSRPCMYDRDGGVYGRGDPGGRPPKRARFYGNRNGGVYGRGDPGGRPP